MSPSRRALIKSAAVSGFLAGAGAFAGCSRKDAPKPSATAEKAAKKEAAPTSLDASIIANAERLNGLSFTDQERAMMIEGLEGALEILAKIRAVELGNHEPPALVFDPKLPRAKVRSQKNVLMLGGNYAAPPPKSEADIAYASVAEQRAWLRSKAITSAALTEAYLKRIARFDKKLNAFVLVTADLAREQAAAADKEIFEGRDRGPLHGIPYALKDLADTAGIATTWGAEPYRDRVPEKDARIVRKLREAGAVLLGKAACGAIAYGDGWFGGVTKNPWNPAEGSSGSSAGSAAAVAAGLCSFAIGTETLGSIISPSERCGTVGLRPTFGRVSRAGLMSLCWSLDKAGPICRRVEDAAIVLSEINGYDADDPGAARVGFAYDGAADLSSLTVGYVPAWFEKGDDADRRALDTLKGLGATLKEFPWPALDFDALEQIVVVEAAAAFSDLTLSNRDDALSWQAPEAWPNTWRQARFFPAVDYVQIDRLRRRVMQAMADAFQGFDALVGPHYAGGALLATNATGHPQLALRAGFATTPNRDLFDDTSEATGADTHRTPRGISIWGNLFGEGAIIRLGRALEDAFGVAAERPPGFEN
ncbi:MAG: amidase [Parvularculaceae bacterium]|nr:amidase [Parvularculaceae bacterium]